jgi:hypothetical protein
MDRHYPPRVVSVTPAESCCTVHLHTGATVLLDLSLASLEAYLQENEFPTVAQLIDWQLIVAYPLPLQMTRAEWETISSILQYSDVFQQIADRFPKLRSGVRHTYEQLSAMPHHLYAGVGMYLDGQGLATLYTSHSLNFRLDEQKGTDWYFKQLVPDDSHLVRVHVNVRTRRVETQTEYGPGHYVTNPSDR